MSTLARILWITDAVLVCGGPVVALVICVAVLTKPRR